MPDQPNRFPPISPVFPHFLHGGDYNPEQWVRAPQVWDQDMKLMKAAHCNTITVGVFSWTALEPNEGEFTFGWLDTIMNKAAENQLRVVLATPGGAKPAWMAERYPQTLRVDERGQRLLWGGRHNHCFTSPVYRQKAAIINGKLAERYGKHPSVVLWHVNNEYSGECHCDLCTAAFREWLKQRYENNLDRLNDAWWSAFWSHGITDWNQIRPPSPIGETQVHGHTLDWKRFVTHQTIDCFRAESEPLRRLTPRVPITTNFMTFFSGLDYYKLAKELDVISWDSYPSLHDRPGDWMEAVGVSFIHNQRRAMQHKPFVLMECSPGVQNYKPVNKLKRPGLHVVEGLHAVAHGSDSVLYFQWRKSRGGVEKFHGAVVDHFPTTETRVFREVTQLGDILAKLDDVIGTTTHAQAAIIFDYENQWAIEGALGPRNIGKNYSQSCVSQYQPFWSAGVDVDVISEEAAFSGYKLLIAPMLYMLRPGVADRLTRFVEQGGTLVVTYLSGVADENDLCFDNGFPGPLRKVCGIWAEEIDCIYDDEMVPIVSTAGNPAGLTGSYEARAYCDLIHAETATVLATYGGEFYKGTPAVTVNQFGKGRVYYIASRNDARFHRDFYNHLIDAHQLQRAMHSNLPEGVTAAVRTDGQRRFVFLLNFTRHGHEIDLGNAEYRDRANDERVRGKLSLPGFSAKVLEPI